MPTRLVLRETPAPSQLTAGMDDSDANHTPMTPQESDLIRRAARSMSSGVSRIGSPSARTSAGRRVVGFRASIIRDISRPNDESPSRLPLSTTDIRASPRLLGYLFCMLASVVMLFSIVQFYRQQDIGTFAFPKERDEILVLNGSSVYVWKLWGSLLMSCVGVVVYLLILLVHFDTVCLPKLWFTIFRDGSKGERNLLLALLCVWSMGLHIGTSTFSLGEAQANVYFTTWIAFGSTALNYGVWRVSASLPSLAEQVNQHARETTYNWMWTLLFALVTAGAATDIWYNRDQIDLKLKGEIIVLRTRGWTTVLAIVWGQCAACFVALALNYSIFQSSVQVQLVGRRALIVGWRQLEGILIVGLVGLNFWIIYDYTGASGVINGLNNAYFGAWGTFFNSVFLFGTWLRENKGIEFFVEVQKQQQQQRQASENDPSNQP